MAHNFSNAYSNVKQAVDGLVASDPLRASLNLASKRFSDIDDDDFDKAPLLRGEFRKLRIRLHRNPRHRTGSVIRSLDSMDSDGMILLARDLLAFVNKMEAPEYDQMTSHKAAGGVLGSLIRDPGPDNWDDDRSLD